MSIAFQEPIVFRYGHRVNIGIKQDTFKVPVPSGKATFVLQKHSEVSSSAWVVVYICNGGRIKVNMKGTSAGRIS